MGDETSGAEWSPMEGTDQRGTMQRVEQTTQRIEQTMQTTKSRGMAKVLALLMCLIAGAAEARQAYDLDSPSDVFKLSDELEEISALSIGPGGLLLAVQDEDGYIYRLDPASGEVLRRDRFAGSGDYEGIEWVGEWIYVLESNGHLYRTPAAQPSRSQTVRIRLDLPGRCDAEGLGWDPSALHFLVACKDADGVRGRKGRSMFSFAENGELLGRELYFAEKQIKQAASTKGLAGFRPSAVAVHPGSGRIFLLTSHDPVLCQIEEDHFSCSPLGLDTMRQPEGLAFDADGALWISSEARGKKPTLHRFDPTIE